MALQLEQAIHRTDAGRARQVCGALRDLYQQQGPGVTSFLHAADPASGILFTNLSRLPLGMLDWGAGPPRDFALLTKAANAHVLTARDGALQLMSSAATCSRACSVPPMPRPAKA